MGQQVNELKTVDSVSFRNIIGHFTSGVSIITAHTDGTDFGLTASAVCSVSLEPPTLLVCINRNAGTSHAISKAKSFGVNILHLQQGHLAKQFATPNIDKFKDVDIYKGSFNQPLLADSLATIECRVVEEVHAGTHAIFIATVTNASVASEKEPLAYYRGKFGQYTML